MRSLSVPRQAGGTQAHTGLTEHVCTTATTTATATHLGIVEGAAHVVRALRLAHGCSTRPPRGARRSHGKNKRSANGLQLWCRGAGAGCVREGRRRLGGAPWRAIYFCAHLVGGGRRCLLLFRDDGCRSTLREPMPSGLRGLQLPPTRPWAGPEALDSELELQWSANSNQGVKTLRGRLARATARLLTRESGLGGRTGGMAAPGLAGLPPCARRPGLLAPRPQQGSSTCLTAREVKKCAVAHC